MVRPLHDLRLRVEGWLNLPHRYSFEKRRYWLAECAGLLVGRAKHTVLCLTGRHHVKFGSWPKCIYCGRVVRV